MKLTWTQLLFYFKIPLRFQWKKLFRNCLQKISSKKDKNSFEHPSITMDSDISRWTSFFYPLSCYNLWLCIVQLHKMFPRSLSFRVMSLPRSPLELYPYRFCLNFNRFLIPFLALLGIMQFESFFDHSLLIVFYCSSQLAPSLKIIDCALFENLKLHFWERIFCRFPINFLL